jgi:serine/threonine protein kinase
MHARGMIHWDIRSANILLDGKAEAQISDFGFVTDELNLGYASGSPSQARMLQLARPN